MKTEDAQLQDKTATAKEPRAAYSMAEFAELFGKKCFWAYRLAAANKIRTITGYGVTMVPASEVDRIVSAANPRKK